MNTNTSVDLKDKLCWTIKEANLMTGIGETTLRALAKNEEYCTIKVGNKTLFKRDRFIKVIENIDYI